MPDRRASRPLPVLVAMIALPLAGCSLLQGPHVRAEVAVDVLTADGAPATAEALDAAADALAGRLGEAGIPVVDAVAERDHVVVRLGASTTDADLDAVVGLAEFSAHAELRPVLLAGAPLGLAAVEPGDEDPAVSPADGSDLAWLTPALLAEFEAEDCTGEPAPAAPDRALVACEVDASVVYALGPVEVPGESLTGAVATERGGTWVVDLAFDDSGTAAFAEVTLRLVALASPRNQFAIVLDGVVISAPLVHSVVTDGRPQISGGFDETAARALAARLRLAALGIRTTVRSSTVLTG